MGKRRERGRANGAVNPPSNGHALENTTILLPHGVISGPKTTWVRTAKLRQLVGYDEQALYEIPSDLPLHSRVTSLLERLVTFADTDEEETRAILKQISIGDRVALLLKARELILGNSIKCTITCASCSGNISLDLSVLDLLQKEYCSSDPKPSYDLEVDGFSLQIRPLTACDQDILVDNINCSQDVLMEMLVRSCIVHSDPHLPASSLPDSLIGAVSSELDEIDPLSEIVLNITCQECAHTFLAVFPVESYVLRELGAHGGQLEQEIHWLAFHYHWSEREILSLSAKKRRRYVELINETLAGEHK
ncbi:MAG: hypothetical protein M1503_02945 [Thaumarchaeota archaeon]|nr:hypothetical protein [Nitrososphaerota archaeon]MCL5317209.1 hypothetical protein [Nitrososphaerota archaeon]